MPLKNRDIFQQALELIIDGVAQSTAEEQRTKAGVYLAGLLIADNKDRLDKEKITAIASIIEMAGEVANDEELD